MNPYDGRIVFDLAGRGLAARGKSADHARFMGLLSRLTDQDRKVISALVHRVRETEARRGENAALSLIDELEEVILTPEC